MSFSVHDGKFDLVIAAGQGIDHFPTIGVRTLSRIASRLGLKTAFYGGAGLKPIGALRVGDSGGLVIIEDAQKRIHRVATRALVRLSHSTGLPDPFPEWLSEGMLTYSMACDLLGTAGFFPRKCVMILGSGNRALALGKKILDQFKVEVYCLELFSGWGAKRYAGWEVHRRAFEIAGGKLIEGKPIGIKRLGPMVWAIRVQDAQGVRLIEVDRVVGVGPYSPHGLTEGISEFPPGSLWFELTNTSLKERKLDVEGWILEEERARLLATRIARSLIDDLGDQREECERQGKRARIRLKRMESHREKPFEPTYQGKWISGLDSREMMASPGIPKLKHRTQFTAAIECFESIGCTLCQESCPEDAIKFSQKRDQILIEDKCTGCGLCLPACPSQSISMIKEPEQASVSQISLVSHEKWKPGELATLLNRRGEPLGSGRIVISPMTPIENSPELTFVEIPAHLTWEARGLRKLRPDYMEIDPSQAHAMKDRVEITLNGETRFVRPGITIQQALYETGLQRREDVLGCPDGSCGLCQVEVDGVRKLACKTEIHPKLSLETKVPEKERGISAFSDPTSFCPCLGTSLDQVVERIRHGNLQSVEAVQAVTHVGEGRCHGRICMENLKRLMEREGVDTSRWVDWRFPWLEWVINP